MKRLEGQRKALCAKKRNFKGYFLFSVRLVPLLVILAFSLVFVSLALIRFTSFGLAPKSRYIPSVFQNYDKILRNPVALLLYSPYY